LDGLDLEASMALRRRNDASCRVDDVCADQVERPPEWLTIYEFREWFKGGGMVPGKTCAAQSQYLFSFA